MLMKIELPNKILFCFFDHCNGVGDNI